MSSASKRGRKRNDNLPPNRARDVQRAFRARRAAHLEALQERVDILEEENARLRELLHMPPSMRPLLGRGPTGKDKPLAGSVGPRAPSPASARTASSANSPQASQQWGPPALGLEPLPWAGEPDLADARPPSASAPAHGSPYGLAPPLHPSPPLRPPDSAPPFFAPAPFEREPQAPPPSAFTQPSQPPPSPPMFLLREPRDDFAANFAPSSAAFAPAHAHAHSLDMALGAASPHGSSRGSSVDSLHGHRRAVTAPDAALLAGGPGAFALSGARSSLHAHHHHLPHGLQMPALPLPVRQFGA